MLGPGSLVAFGLLASIIGLLPAVGLPCGYPARRGAAFSTVDQTAQEVESDLFAWLTATPALPKRILNGLLGLPSY